LTAQRREHLAQMAGARRELATVVREIRKVIQAIKDGVPGAAVRDEMGALEARKAALTIALAEPPVPALHPNMAEIFRRKATTLAAGLEHDGQRDAAREALRGFLEKIVIPPGDGLLQVVGNVGAMLTAAQGRTANGRAVGYGGCGGAQHALFGVPVVRGRIARSQLKRLSLKGLSAALSPQRSAQIHLKRAPLLTRLINKAPNRAAARVLLLPFAAFATGLVILMLAPAASRKSAVSSAPCSSRFITAPRASTSAA
jgi:hypothetical protein